MLLLPAFSSAQQSADSLPTITLAQALDRARKVNPALANGEANVRSARATRMTVKGEYLPSLGVAFIAGRGTAVQGASPVSNGVAVPSALRSLDNTYGSGISTSIPVYTGGRSGAQCGRVRCAARNQAGVFRCATRGRAGGCRDGSRDAG